mmetsp:Transcript_27600/g.50105  ORF Transcript_27600/g.50105 Transcript_27600/m.50105 type:complete len:96 (+) Transcript_27600:118-405(+)
MCLKTIEIPLGSVQSEPNFTWGMFEPPQTENPKFTRSQSRSLHQLKKIYSPTYYGQEILQVLSDSSMIYPRHPPVHFAFASPEMQRPARQHLRLH